MNALELADELDDMLKAIGLTDNRVPTMLRQQQAEIEALKGGFFDWSGFKELTDEEIDDFTVVTTCSKHGVIYGWDICVKGKTFPTCWYCVGEFASQYVTRQTIEEQEK